MERCVYVPNRASAVAVNLTIKKGQLLQIVRNRTNATVLSPCRVSSRIASKSISKVAAVGLHSVKARNIAANPRVSAAVCAYAKTQRTIKSTWHHVHAVERTVLLALSAIFRLLSAQCRSARSPMELLQILVRRAVALQRLFTQNLCVLKRPGWNATYIQQAAAKAASSPCIRWFTQTHAHTRGLNASLMRQSVGPQAFSIRTMMRSVSQIVLICLWMVIGGPAWDVG